MDTFFAGAQIVRRKIMRACSMVFVASFIVAAVLTPYQTPAYAQSGLNDPDETELEQTIPDEMVGDASVSEREVIPSPDEALLPAPQADGGVVTDQAPAEVQAAGVLPSALFDLNETGWASYRDMSSSQFADKFQELKDDYLMTDVEIDSVGGEYKAAAVWQRNDTNRSWAEYRNLDNDEFHDKWTELKGQGYRLIDQESYVWNGRRLYAGVWVENSEGYAWASWRNLTSAEFSDKFNEYKDQYIMVDVEAYPTSDGLRYAMIWVRNAENLGWIERRNLSDQQFSDEFQQNKDAYRVWDVESYRYNGTQYYAVIWLENKNGRNWAEYRDMSATDYRNRWYRMRDLGYRLIDFEMYESSSGVRYAGAWRQNSDRPDWALKGQMDILVDAYRADNSLPGIGVAVAQGNEIKYMRGFGYQDVNDGVWYSAHTINGLASISKAVGGILAMNMYQDGTLSNLDAAASTLIPGLPGHHSYTVRQLLSNRSGIGHYEDHSEPIAQHPTALSAAQDFWDEPLVYTPGSGCKYSTHAYTFLGAALEGAAGKSISQLVSDELSVPYALSTLQLDDTGNGGGNRTTRYDVNNAPVTVSNSSWKVLGGGLEASAYDLVRLGMKTLNGSVLTADSLVEMQTVPQPTPCTTPENQSNYALGWNVGTHQGAAVMWKGGSWVGADTNIRMYPDEEIVIVVLTNRTENHNSANLATAIGALLLDNESSPAGSSMDVDGIPHTVLGQLDAYRVENGLYLSNFGATGEDGIRIGLPEDTVLWKGELSIDVGQRARSVSNAVFNAMADEAIQSSLIFTGSDDGLAIESYTGNSPYGIQLILGDELVARSDGSQPFMVNWDEIFCLLELPGGVPSEICDILVAYQTDNLGRHEWNISLPEAIMVQDGNGHEIEVDRIRLLQPDAEAPVADGTIGHVEIKAANISALTLQKNVTGSEPEDTEPTGVPLEPGDTSTVYLPFVLNQ